MRRGSTTDGSGALGAAARRAPATGRSRRSSASTGPGRRGRRAHRVALRPRRNLPPPPRRGPGVRQHENVVSLKAARALGPEHDLHDAGYGTSPRPSSTATTVGPPVPADRRRRGRRLSSTGAATSITRTSSTATARPGCWRCGISADPPTTRAPQPYGYGTVHDRATDRRRAAHRRPVRRVGLPPRRRRPRWRGAHGTHVMDIAAGNGLAGGRSASRPKPTSSSSTWPTAARVGWPTSVTRCGSSRPSTSSPGRRVAGRG